MRPTHKKEGFTGLNMTNETILELRGVEKQFGETFRLGPLDLELATGDTVALIGKNGAGKSTFLDLITGTSDATAGTVMLTGERLTPEKFMLKRSIGYMPQSLYLPRWVTGYEILRYAAGLYSLDDSSLRIDESLKYWDCAFYRNRPLAACSHGMQKRVGLALATLHDPTLLILDEPFSGLDIYHIRALEGEVARRAKCGKTTIISTHIVPIAAKLCDRVILVYNGQFEHLTGIHEKPYLEKIEMIEQRFFAKNSE
jgi:ABC-type multidrug transport system ATPase subunit